MEMTENIQNFFETLSAMEQQSNDRNIGIFAFYKDRTFLDLIQQKEKEVTIYLGQYVDPKSAISKESYFKSLKNQVVESIVAVGPLSQNEFWTIINIYLQKYTVVSSLRKESAIIFNAYSHLFQVSGVKTSSFFCGHEPFIWFITKTVDFSDLIDRNQSILTSFANYDSSEDYIQRAYQRSYQDYFAELYETVKKPYQLEIKRPGK